MPGLFLSGCSRQGLINSYPLPCLDPPEQLHQYILTTNFVNTFPTRSRAGGDVLFQSCSHEKGMFPFRQKCPKQNSPLFVNHIFMPCALTFRPTFPPTHFFSNLLRALDNFRGRSEKFGLPQPWGSLRFPSPSRLRLKSTSSARI